MRYQINTAITSGIIIALPWCRTKIKRQMAINMMAILEAIAEPDWFFEKIVVILSLLEVIFFGIYHK
jgi:hypothetical protein